MPTDQDAKPLISLASMQVDVTTRMGALTPATPTGLPSLDAYLLGGLRRGTLLSVAGAPGSGRTALALLIAYMAARAGAAVLFASVSLDETEVMARLSARALHREYPDARTPYGAIWSGEAWQDDLTQRPVRASVETVVKKVGSLLYVYRARCFAPTAELGDCAAELWERHERVLLVVDDLEAFSASAEADRSFMALANQGLESRVSQAAYDLRQISEQGCAVITTVLSRHAELVAGPATLATEIRTSGERSSRPGDDPLGTRPVELSITKNRFGPSGTILLDFVPGAGIFEERA